MTRVLVAGVSTRAAADSAARAGFDVTTIDGYADRDQHPAVRALSVRRELGLEFTAENACAAALREPCDAVVYLSNFENHPEAVATLTGGRTLWGNPPGVLRQVRNPFTVAATFRRHGIAVPNVSNVSNDSNVSNVSNDSNDSSAWLLKPFSSGGGHGVRDARASRVLPEGFYRQQKVAGTPGSIVFVAAAGKAAPLGLSRQLIGDPRFGAAGYRYCGSIIAPVHDRQFQNGSALTTAARDLAAIAAAEFELVGLNGIDFIARAGRAYPIEINPRWSASMELFERAFGVTLFATHAAACTDGVLSTTPGEHARARGKAIVFARESCVVGNTDSWLANDDIRDIPHTGDPIAAGSPVCTVFAEAADSAACEAALAVRAERIYVDMRRWAEWSEAIQDRRSMAHE
jgi:uncharacterized protein